MRPLLLALALVLLPVSVARAAPIEGAPTTAPPFVGAPAIPSPIAAPLPPQHPFLAPNERSNLHNDGHQTDSYRGTGPLGRDPQVLSEAFGGVCASIAFDSRGRIVTVCVSVRDVTLRLVDPRTLQGIAAVPLPPRTPRPGSNPFQDFTGGGYFYLDERDRAVLTTADKRLRVYSVVGDGFRLDRDVPLAGVVGEGDGIISALPDHAGRVWFVSRGGIVGTVSPDDRVRTIDTEETTGNSFAAAEEGQYIVTDRALYRFTADADGTPRVVWRQAYDNDGTQKPGQSQPGSGTTPTVLPGGLVAITDNADPINVVVYRTAAEVTGPREVCRQAVFEKGASSSDQSLITDGTNLVVENNYGYEGPPSVSGGRSTVAGLARVDVDAAAGRCSLRWTSKEIAPTAVPKLALGAGLVYTYTKDPDPSGQDPWYLTAIDHATGRTVFKVLAGAGPLLNNNYAPITLSADGTAYIGVLGGIAAVRDAVPPQVAPAPVVPAASTEPRRRPRRPRVSVVCGRRGTAVVIVRGGKVRRVRVVSGGRSRTARHSAPVRLRIRPGRRVRVTVVTAGGRRVVTRPTQRCRR